MKLTIETLRKNYTNRKELAIFEKEFPNGMEPTEENITKLIKWGWEWTAEETFLTSNQRDKFWENLDPIIFTYGEKLKLLEVEWKENYAKELYKLLKESKNE